MVRDQIWEELKKAKTYGLCALDKCDKLRKYQRCFSRIILFISIVGALLCIFKSYFGVYVTIIIAVASVVKEFFQNFRHPEFELESLDALARFYDSHLNKLERLWNQYENKTKSEDQCVERLAKLKKDSVEKDVRLNKLIHHIRKGEQQKLDTKIKEYLERNFFGNE